MKIESVEALRGVKARERESTVAEKYIRREGAAGPYHLAAITEQVTEEQGILHEILSRSLLN